MENMDPGMQERVWQRVMGQSMEQGRMDVRPLMLAALELAMVYRRLARGSSGSNREMLQKLYEGEMANIACMKGISSLSGAGAMKLAAPPAASEPGAKALEKCYHRSRRAVAEYTAHSAEPEFGIVFQRMAERERMLCAMVVELLGELGK